MPGRYLDTQFSDGEWRSYTVGTTMAERFRLHTRYFGWVAAPQWNSTSSNHRKLHYKLEKWRYHATWLFGCESSPWCVGTNFLNDGGKEQQNVFSPGAYLAPYSRTY